MKMTVYSPAMLGNIRVNPVRFGSTDPLDEETRQSPEALTRLLVETAGAGNSPETTQAIIQALTEHLPPAASAKAEQWKQAERLITLLTAEKRFAPPQAIVNQLKGHLGVQSYFKGPADPMGDLMALKAMTVIERLSRADDARTLAEGLVGESLVEPRPGVIAFAEDRLMAVFNRSRTGYSMAEMLDDIFSAQRAYTPRLDIRDRITRLSD